MLRRITSAISLDTIDPDAEPYRDDWDSEVPTSGQVVADEGSGGSLCDRCQNFDIQSFTRSATRRKGYLLKDVEASANLHCGFCAILWDAVKDIERPEYFYTNSVGPGRTVTNPDLYVHMTVSESYKENRQSALSSGLRANRLLIELGDRFSGDRNASPDEICFAADPSSAAASSGDISGRYIGFDPASESHFETSRNWIEACQVHEKCNETVSGANQIQPRNSPLPTRVIEVVREAGQQRVYLRHTDGLQGAYITLTHRWNEFTGQCITTTANLEQRLLGHDFGSLPQLFQDAFTIAERLEIKYIWIDSLCIIQKGDDYTDWKREAPKMAQYYQYSLFTLAGTADDMTGGLMVAYPEEKAPWASSLVQLPYRDKTNAVNGFFYAYKRRTPLVDEYMEQVRSSILFRRGWILQEWLLSKRLLWYTPNGLFYECQQDLPRSYDQSQITFERANPELRSHLQLKAAFHHSNRDILAFWYKALEVYTGQHLTQVTDRVLAVAGLAKEVAPILSNPQRLASMWPEVQNQVYVAGLWLRDIHHGLLWEQAHSASPATTIVEAAPTWSWASLMTPVIWPEKLKGTESAFQVTGICFSEKKRHDIPDQLVHENYKLRPFNAVGETPHFDPTNMFSCLHIRGKLHTVHVRGYLESDENLKNAAISSAYSPIPKSCNWRAICSAFRPEIIAGWVSAERLISPQAACSDYGNAVYALHVSTRYLRHGLWLKRSEPVMDVLLLEKAEDRSGVFRRLGVGRIADRELIKEIGEADEQAIQLV